MNLNRECTMSLDCGYINSEVFNQLIGADLTTPEPTYKITATGIKEIKTQCRKHKSKRINKKWGKRYGFNITHIPYDIVFDKCTINSDGSFTATTNKL